MLSKKLTARLPHGKLYKYSDRFCEMFVGLEEQQPQIITSPCLRQTNILSVLCKNSANTFMCSVCGETEMPHWALHRAEISSSLHPSLPSFTKQKGDFMSAVEHTFRPKVIYFFPLLGDSILKDRGWLGPVHGAEQPDQGRGGGEGWRVILPPVSGGVPAGIHRHTTWRIPWATQI